MSGTILSAGVCDDFHADNLNATYDVRFVLFLLTNLLSPCYTLLSLVAVASRRNSILKAFAVHGKTSIEKVVVNTSCAVGRGTGRNNARSKHNLDHPSESRLSQCWISKRRFVHFYVSGLVSTAIATLFHMNAYYNRRSHHDIDTETLDKINLTRTAAVVVLVIHIARRAYECLYIQQYRKESSKMHIMAYLLGLGHYIVLPLVFWDIDATNGSDDIFSDVNVRDKIFFFGSRIVDSATEMDPGAKVFILAMIGILSWLQYEQHKHHIILADIRRFNSLGKKKIDAPRQNRHYSLPPHQRWFRYILSPHYLAEILLYLSFAIILEKASGATMEHTVECKNIRGKNVKNLSILERIIIHLLIPGRRYRHWTLFGWVATNLTISAMNSYDWYSCQYKNFNTKSGNPTTDSSSRQPAEKRDERRAIFPKIL